MHIHQVLKNFSLFMLLAAILCLSLAWQNHYIGLSIGLGLLSMLFLLYRFEKRKIEAGELVLLAVIAAIAAVGRIPFASIPSVQPTTFVIMMAGFVFGAESGFIIGATAALASNMILGQGPWTPWQMAAWGLVGYTAGLLQNTSFMKSTCGKIIFGIVWGFLFGWIMNLWGYFSLVQSEGTMSVKSMVSYFAASSLFDSMHAISNVFFLLVFGKVWIKNLSRFKKKFGLFDEK